VVQDVVLQTDNVRFLKEKWYSPTTRETYLASLPDGYEGQFGATVKALVLSLYYSGGMSAPKIIEFIEQIGVNLSKGIVSTWLSVETEQWETEADEIIKAGLDRTDYQHLDETGTRVDGENHYCHILCNPFYTAYLTRPRKDRLTVIGVLQNCERPRYLFNEQTMRWLEQLSVPKWAQSVVATWEQAVLFDEEAVNTLFEGELNDRLNEQQQARIREAGALTAYYAQDAYPVIPILISDDAPQFYQLTAKQMLCWVHEGRHYKKLSPHLPYHRSILDQFLTDFWAYYHKLQAYRSTPDPPTAEALRTDFDTLFGKTTGYDHLDQRLAKTMAHKQKLLVVLDHPHIPLHNNPAELGARQRVRKRDVSFGPRSRSGRVAWDVLMTMAETAKKLGISFYRYLFDRVSMQNKMPSLAELVRAQKFPSYP